MMTSPTLSSATASAVRQQGTLTNSPYTTSAVRQQGSLTNRPSTTATTNTRAQLEKRARLSFEIDVLQVRLNNLLAKATDEAAKTMQHSAIADRYVAEVNHQIAESNRHLANHGSIQQQIRECAIQMASFRARLQTSAAEATP